MTEILILGLQDLLVLKTEFQEIFQELFNEAKSHMKKELLNKLEAIKHMDYMTAQANPKSEGTLTQRFNYHFLTGIQNSI